MTEAERIEKIGNMLAVNRTLEGLGWYPLSDIVTTAKYPPEEKVYKVIIRGGGIKSAIWDSARTTFHDGLGIDIDVTYWKGDGEWLK